MSAYRRKQKRNAKKKGKSKGKRCTCPCTGGFAEALPMDVWLDVMKQVRACPTHGGQ